MRRITYIQQHINQYSTKNNQKCRRPASKYSNFILIIIYERLTITSVYTHGQTKNTKKKLLNYFIYLFTNMKDFQKVQFDVQIIVFDKLP